jgi:hypothetical protein
LFVKLKNSLEEDFESKKWSLCADQLQDEHETPKYPAKALEKLYKKLEKEGRIQEGKLIDNDDQKAPAASVASVATLAPAAPTTPLPVRSTPSPRTDLKGTEVE